MKCKHCGEEVFYEYVNDKINTFCYDGKHGEVVHRRTNNFFCIHKNGQPYKDHYSNLILGELSHEHNVLELLRKVDGLQAL